MCPLAVHLNGKVWSHSQRMSVQCNPGASCKWEACGRSTDNIRQSRNKWCYTAVLILVTAWHRGDASGWWNFMCGPHQQSTYTHVQWDSCRPACPANPWPPPLHTAVSQSFTCHQTISLLELMLVLTGDHQQHTGGDLADDDDNSWPCIFLQNYNEL